MQLLKHMEAHPLVPETGKEIHQFAYVQVFQISATICLQWYMRFLHMEVLQMDADIPLCSEEEKGVDLDISLATLAGRCRQTYLSRK